MMPLPHHLVPGRNPSYLQSVLLGFLAVFYGVFYVILWGLCIVTPLRLLRDRLIATLATALGMGALLIGTVGWIICRFTYGVLGGLVVKQQTVQEAALAAAKEVAPRA